MFLGQETLKRSLQTLKKYVTRPFTCCLRPMKLPGPPAKVAKMTATDNAMVAAATSTSAVIARENKAEIIVGDAEEEDGDDA